MSPDELTALDAERARLEAELADLRAELAAAEGRVTALLRAPKAGRQLKARVQKLKAELQLAGRPVPAPRSPIAAFAAGLRDGLLVIPQLLWRGLVRELRRLSRRERVIVVAVVIAAVLLLSITQRVP